MLIESCMVMNELIYCCRVITVCFTKDWRYEKSEGNAVLRVMCHSITSEVFGKRNLSMFIILSLGCEGRVIIWMIRGTVSGYNSFTLCFAKG